MSDPGILAKIAIADKAWQMVLESASPRGSDGAVFVPGLFASLSTFLHELLHEPAAVQKAIERIERDVRAICPPKQETFQLTGDDNGTVVDMHRHRAAPAVGAAPILEHGHCA